MAAISHSVKRAIWIGLGVLCSPWVVLGQTDARQALRKGNRAYEKGAYEAAQKAYESGDPAPKWDAMRSFNLGDALYRQERYAEAEKAYAEAWERSSDRQLKAKALHNLGNARFQQKNYKGAAEGYAESLKLRPGDAQAQYNLAQSLRKLGAPPPPQNQPQNSPDEQQSKGEQQPQDQNGSRGDQDSPKPQGTPDQPEEGDSKPQPGGMRPEEVEQLLDALEQEDARVQKKLQADKKAPKTPLDGKNW